MKINIFEGTRRIAKLIGVVIVLVTLFYAIVESPEVTGSLQYEVTSAFAPLTKSSVPCELRDEEKFIYVDSPKGVSVHVSICFRAIQFNNKRWLIPYKVEGDNVLGNESYTTEVQNYMNEVLASSVIPPEEIKKFDEFLFFKKLWETIKTIGIGAISLVCFYLAVVLIGWVVRGFLGIPTGSDERPEQ